MAAATMGQLAGEALSIPRVNNLHENLKPTGLWGASAGVYKVRTLGGGPGEKAGTIVSTIG